MTVTGIAPSVTAPGGQVHICGTCLDAGTGQAPTVYIDGKAAPITHWSSSSIEAGVPQAVDAGVPPGPRPIIVDVMASDGSRTTSIAGELTV